TNAESIFHVHRARVLEQARKYRLPGIHAIGDSVEAGALMSLTTDRPSLYGRTATIVHRILKGARPADIPIEQATKFDLVIKQRTASTLGLTIPPALLLRADRVIE